MLLEFMIMEQALMGKKSSSWDFLSRKHPSVLQHLIPKILMSMKALPSVQRVQVPPPVLARVRVQALLDLRPLGQLMALQPRGQLMALQPQIIQGPPLSKLFLGWN